MIHLIVIGSIAAWRAMEGPYVTPPPPPPPTAGIGALWGESTYGNAVYGHSIFG